MSSEHLAGYAAVLDALDGAYRTTAERAVALDAAAELVGGWSADHDRGITARAARGLATALACLADFERWAAGTVAAEVDAERHRRSAEYKARAAAEALDVDDPVLGPLRAILEQIASVRDLQERGRLRDDLAGIPVPLALIDARRSPRAARPSTEPQTSPMPRAAIIPAIDGSPITFAHAIEPGVHDLEVEARVLDWPADARELVLRFLSHWPRTAVDVTDIHLARPDEETDGVRVARGTAHLALHATAADPAKPVRLTIEGQLLSGDTGGGPLRLLGHRDLAVRTYDPKNDVITGAPALDERILTMLAELREAAVAPHEQEPFGRFFGPIARAGVRIVMEREFPTGSNPTEKEFQQELLKRVAMASELGGRVQEHAWQAGGPTDLIHDGVVAELKVERDTPATLENAASYMAQATQYASGGQRQLSILVILDMTPKEAPPGVLANTIGWLEPSLHGLDDPAYPSMVGTVIINGNLPLPSSWSR